MTRAREHPAWVVDGWVTWLKNHMNARQWTTKKLSTVSGIHDGHLRNLLSACNIPKRSTIEALCRGFGVPVSEGLIAAGYIPTPSAQQVLAFQAKEVGTQAVYDLETKHTLSPVRLQILALIITFQTTRQRSPFTREIARKLRCTVGEVHNHLGRLKQLGWIRWAPNKDRSVARDLQLNIQWIKGS